MNVLVVSSKYPPEYAGSGLRIHNTYQRLRDRFDVDAEVLCGTTEFDEPDRYEQEGVDVQRIVHMTSKRWLNRELPGPLRRVARGVRYMAEARRTRRELEQRDFDVLHVVGQSAPTVAATIWSRETDTPLMLEIVNERASPYMYPPNLGWATDYDLKRQCVVVAISSALGEMCARHGLDDNVWVRPNPVDEDRFRHEAGRDPDLVEELTSFDAEDRILLYVGKFRPSKNHAFLVDVIDEMPEEYKLVVGGPVVSDGPNRDRDRRLVEQLRERVDRRDLSDRIDVRTEFVDMARHLRIADAFLHPSTEEGLGTPVLESLCSGVPVVANEEVDSFHQMIDHDHNGYLVPLDPAEWADAVRQAVQFDPERRRSISEDCREQASSRTVDSAYARLLETLVKANPNVVLDVSDVLAGAGQARSGMATPEDQ